MKKLLNIFVWRVFFVGAFLSLVFLFLYSPQLVEKKGVGRGDLNLLVWPQMFTPEALEEFSQLYNVRVNMTYFDSNDELIAKLSLAGGSEYDVVTVTDFSMDQFIDRNLLEPFDASSASSFEGIHKRLIDFVSHKGVIYAMPYAITLYGLGVNNDYLPMVADPSWRLLFDGKHRACMTDDPIEVVSVAEQYLRSLQPQVPTAANILKLLQAQRANIEAYSDVRVDYFLTSGACIVAMAPSFAVSMARAGGAPVEFYLPKEGGFLIMDNLAVSSSSGKKALSFKFIEFMMQRDRLYAALSKFGMLAPDLAVAERQDLAYFQTNKKLEQVYAQTPRIKHSFDRATLNKLWLDLKA